MLLDYYKHRHITITNDLKRCGIDTISMKHIIMDKEICMTIINCGIDPALFHLKFISIIGKRAEKQIKNYEYSEKINELFDGYNFEGDRFLEEEFHRNKYFNGKDIIKYLINKAFEDFIVIPNFIRIYDLVLIILTVLTLILHVVVYFKFII